MNALLPYLKQIADALNSRNKTGDTKRDAELSSIAKSIGTSTVTNNNVSIAGNENVKAINETLSKGLIVNVQDGSSEYQKSIFALIFEMLQNAMFVTVTENGQQVTKGIAQLLKEQNENISHIKDALYDSTTTPATTILTKISNMDTKLSAIANGVYDNTTTPATTVLTKLDEIADAMGGGSVDAQTIADGIDQSSALQAIHGVLATDTNNILDKVMEIEDNTSYTQGISVFAESIDNKLGSNNTSGTLLSNTSYIQGISVFVQDIDNKMPNNS